MALDAAAPEVFFFLLCFAFRFWEVYERRQGGLGFGRVNLFVCSLVCWIIREVMNEFCIWKSKSYDFFFTRFVS